MRIRGGNKDEIPYMAVNCYQQQEGDDGQGRKLLLDVGPKPVGIFRQLLKHDKI